MISVSIVGASGYVGGELIRLLLDHPEVTISQITSERFANKFLKSVHPIFRGISSLKFSKINELIKCDLLFLCLPHGEALKNIDHFISLSEKIIDLSADFRLKSEEQYLKYYKHSHDRAELLEKFIYGIPELYREKITRANLVSSAGCNATVSILALKPLIEAKIIDQSKIFIDVKVGTSEAGNKVNSGSHHPERVRSLRSYKPTSHRHVAEIEQELGNVDIYFSATSIDMVRGVLATIQTFLIKDADEKQIWKIYRDYYKNSPFVRIIKEKSGNYRYPDPKTLLASNYCDIGFEIDPDTNRMVVIGAIDNLMKGAAGQAVQAFNIMYNFQENLGLTFPGLHLY